MTKLIFLIAKLIFKGLSALFGWWAIPIMGGAIALLAIFGKSGDSDTAAAESGPEDLLAVAAVGSGVLAAVDDKTGETPCCPAEDAQANLPPADDSGAATPDSDTLDFDWTELA